MSKRNLKWALCLAVTGLIAVGCDDKKDDAPMAPVTPTMTPPTTPGETPEPTMTPAPTMTTTPAPSMSDTANKTMDQAKATGDNMMNGAKDAGTNAMDAGKSAMSTTGTKMSNGASDAATGVNAMSADSEKMATDMIGKVQTYIKENKLDDASNMLTKLEEMKAKLPQGLQDQISKLRPMLDAAKNMKMPSMPGMK